MKGVRILKVLFLLIGLATLCGAAALLLHTRQFIAGAVSAPGVVTELVPHDSGSSTTWAPVVRYNAANGEPAQFTSSTSSSPPAFRVGEAVAVLYRPDDPGTAKIDSFFSLWGGALILGILGAVFAAVGGAMFLVDPLARRGDERLRRSGRPVLADYEGVRLNTMLKLNGRSPYRVLAQWRNPETAKVHVFESHNIWYDPTRYIDRSQLTVYLDRRSPRRYYVDLSFLPEAAD
jgi:hypothetical protein